MRLALLLALLATTAAAETRMTAAEFEAWSTGQTLDYAVDGIYYGSEMHLSGRQTRDADAGGPCRAGHWYPVGDDICFVYEDSPGPHCWRFWRDGKTVRADVVGNLDAPVSEVTLSEQPLACPGPDVGV